MNENPCTNPIRGRHFVEGGDDVQRLSEDQAFKIKGFANLASSGIAFASHMIVSPHSDIIQTASAGTMPLIAEWVLSVEV